MAHAELENRGLDAEEDQEAYEEAWDEAIERAKEEVAEQHDEVVELGGLYVLGTERHESRRIDNQLRGRSGRQGDPGESRFYLSLQDDLMRLFNSGAAESLLARGGVDESIPLTGRMVSGAIQRAQNSIESRNAEIRKNVLKYDDVLTKQRKKFYEERSRILEGEDLDAHIERFIEEVIGGTVDAHTTGKPAEDIDLEELWGALRPAFPVSLTPEDVLEEVGGKENLEAGLLKEEILADARVAYEKREEELGEEGLAQLQRRVLLSVMDRRWREHLYEMDYLKEGIGLRAMAQRDPLIEYEREGHLMFNDMMAGVKEDVVGYVYNLEVQVEKAQPVVPTAVTALLRGASTRAAAVEQAGSGSATDGADAETSSASEDAPETVSADGEDASADGTEDAGTTEADGAEDDGTEDAEDPRAEQLEAESSVVLRAKGLDDGPNERQLRYSSAEGSDVQDVGTLTRAQRRRRARTGDAPASSTVSDKPEGAPQGDGMNRAQRRAGRRRKG
jgi:preprotein translocase subunit SecA